MNLGSTLHTVEKTGIIVVNYRTAEKVILLHRNVLARMKRDSSRVEFIIVDNCSGSFDTRLLKESFSKTEGVTLILSEVNHGYSRGNNIGLRKAVELNLTYSLIANSDISFETDDFIDKFAFGVCHLPACGLIGPKILLPNGLEQNPIPEGNILNSVFSSKPISFDASSEVYATTGCCVFGATATFHAIGLFDENLFLYREEWILAERLRNHRLKWYFLPSVVIKHDHERKLGSISRLLRHKRYEYESSLYFFKNYKKSSFVGLVIYRVLFIFRLCVFVFYFYCFPKLKFQSRSL